VPAEEGDELGPALDLDRVVQRSRARDADEAGDVGAQPPQSRARQRPVQFAGAPAALVFLLSSQEFAASLIMMSSGWLTGERQWLR